MISPLLANIYLDPLDAVMAERGYRMVRYADDFVILCRSARGGGRRPREVRAWVAQNGLALHPDKTHVGDCGQPGQGFEFLGYRFEAGRRHVRQKSLTSLKDSIREKTRRTRGDSLARSSLSLNPLLRGWFGYFKHAHHTTFDKLDGFVRRRLRALLRKQEKRPRLRAHAAPTINAGQMPSSRKPGCSRFTRPGCPRDSLDERNHRLESRMRENRPYGSEGGDGESRSLPLSEPTRNRWRSWVPAFAERP